MVLHKNNIKKLLAFNYLFGPDVAVVLITRWNALTIPQQNETYPPVASNFIIKLCSQFDSPQYIHNKMLHWINGGVEISR
ncbi:hypothetical protein C1645_823222 [Glomus cerebriforme]|uniref:Uncharacterized protein n=1 Tax=Glomus cerebriforme TaxID=658196 RepID=A0A397T659_9GLOM|nr:hypothetical protein C1645_823222 [Glomus cerebriforme]